MADTLPRTTHRTLQFEHGQAIGISNRWQEGQYCCILTPAGIVGCGIYDLVTPAEFHQAIAIARGTPACPLAEPEDLFEARIVGVTPRAAGYGIRTGMTGREAVERMLQSQAPAAADTAATDTAAPVPRVRTLDHVTLVVKHLERSRQFYVDVLGMRQVPRPPFSFDGLWFQAGATQVHLILEHEQSGPGGNLVPEARRTSRSHHLAFAVDDAAAFADYLRGLGHQLVAGPAPRPDGHVQTFVSDPDGHVVELCSPPS